MAAGAPRVGQTIDRPRVIRLLRGRFDHLVTLVQAPAGAGKTTSLRLSMAANRAEPFGTDVYYATSRHDEDPDHLLDGLADALGAHVRGTVSERVVGIADAVWSSAPRDVVLILDDTHLLDGTPSADVLALLVDALPANGHIVLSSRTRPALSLARLRAHGQVLELTSADLGLDDDELAALIRLRIRPTSPPPGDLPRLAAVADLRLRAGPGADAEFLWEEVLSSLDDGRRRVLQRASVLQIVDDELVAALSDGAFAVADLVDGLPLVEPGDHGSVRMHPILRSALAERPPRGELAAAGRFLADVEWRRGNHRAAIELWADAGDAAAAIDAARRFALLPVMRRTFGDLLVVRSLVDQIDAGSVLGDLLRVESQFGELSTTTDVNSLGAQLIGVADRARETGDRELEAMALFRAWEWISIERLVPADLVGRLVDLADDDVAIARQTVRFVLAEAAMFRGEPERAIELLGQQSHVDGADPDVEMILRSGLLCSLGRPELVGAGLTTADLASMPEGSELYVGFALWNRGQLTPEHALEIALAMTTEVLARRVVHPIVAIRGVTSFMALAAGDTAIAERHIERARDEARYGCAAHLLAFTAMAEAATTLTTVGEDEAGARLRMMLDAVPLGEWPIRGYLLGLSMLYVLVPDVRVSLDRCRFGPALTTAVAAGRALVELRSTGSVAAAAALPWHSESCLRAHVLPVHLCELAVAAGLEGVSVASDLVERLPNAVANLRRVAALSTPAVARAAGERLEVVRAPVPADGRLIALGRVALIVDGRPVGHPDWERRARVRELFALVAIERRPSRGRAAGLLWPELDQSKALRNLRVTLFYLNRALADAGLGPAAVHPVSDALELAFDLATDVDDFDDLVRQASVQDRAGAPAAAKELYHRAVALYGGDFIADLQCEWIRPARTRLQLLAASSMLRVGELELAAGEPDRAVHWAMRVGEMFPNNERAGRLFAACHVGVGARTQAATVLRELIAGLRADGVEPEPETTRALHRLAPELGSNS